MNTVEEMLDYVAMFRGHFINKMTYIERAMEMIIATHYTTEDKVVELIDFLLGEKHVFFEGKRLAFKQIIEKHHPHTHEKSKKMFEHLNKIMEHRNKIAHYMVCTTDEAIERFEKDKSFGLLQYFEKKQPIWYDEKLQTELSQAVDEVFRWLEIK